MDDALRHWKCPPSKCVVEDIVIDFYIYANTAALNKEIFRKYYIIGGITFEQIGAMYGFTGNNARQRARRCYWKTRRLLIDGGVFNKETGVYNKRGAVLLKQKLAKEE